MKDNRFYRRKIDEKSSHLTDEDKWFLGWIYDRMINHHKEKADIDYMKRFKKLIDDL